MRRRSILWTACAVALCACSDSTAPKLVDTGNPRFTCVSDAPGVDLPAKLRAELDTTRLLSRGTFPNNLPGGFAGVYATDYSTVVLQFVDPVAAQSIQPVSKLLDDLGVPANARKYVTYQKERWSLLQLDDWFQYLAFGISSPSPTGISDLQEDHYRNAITLGVIDEAARSGVIALYNAAGFPCNLIRTVVEPMEIDRAVR